MMNGIHIYEGACPDEVNGKNSRDYNCPCCQALMFAERKENQAEFAVFLQYIKAKGSVPTASLLLSSEW